MVVLKFTKQNRTEIRELNRKLETNYQKVGIVKYDAFNAVSYTHLDVYKRQMYIGGMSSSLPEDVQYDMYRSVAGLEHAKIVRNAYAIEYLSLIHILQLRVRITAT